MTVNPLVLIAILLTTFTCRAERLFIGILEADSIQSIHYGAAAFSRISDLPLVQEQVQARLAQACCCRHTPASQHLKH
jgi:hypothetical protein